MRSDRTLQNLYRQYNKQYFGGKLPHLVVGFKDPSYFRRSRRGKKTVAITEFEDGKPTAIFIQRIRRVHGMVEFDLLHEMCHVSKPRATHGPVFQKEMTRLAKAGAFRELW